MSMLFHDEDDYDGWGGGKPEEGFGFEDSIGGSILTGVRKGSWYIHSKIDSRR